MYFLMDELTESFQRLFDKFRHANKAAYELSKLSDKELDDLGLNRVHIPFVSHMSAFKNDN